MTCIQFNYAAFIQYYAQFSNDALYPKATLNLYWNEATTIVNNNTYAGGLTLQQRTRALNLMTAHLAVLNGQAAAGQQGGLVQGATIDKVSVQLTPPPEATQFQWWCNQTQYGQMYLAMLDSASVGGFYFNGYPTTYTLRR